MRIDELIAGEYFRYAGNILKLQGKFGNSLWCATDEYGNVWNFHNGSLMVDV